jgi:hypothetical protein
MPLSRCVCVAACAVVAVAASAQSQELPPRDAFLREAREALARSQRVWHLYSYQERRTDLNLNPFGRMGTTGTRVTEVRPSADPRLTYRRVVERNGVAVGQGELDRQDAEYRARVARIAREDAARADRAEQDEKLARRRAELIVEDVVNALQFDLVRRDARNGRPTIVVSFAGRPGARPTTREGRVAKVFKGEVWIDEASREVIDLNAVATDDVTFGGFVGKIYQGTQAAVERREIEPGVWMPSRLTLKGDVRALFRKARIDHVVEWFDYRRNP